MLINLLKNAHEAGSPEEEITVSIRPAPGGGAAIRVSDRGRGHGRGDHEAGPGARSSRPSPPGRGLGLPLCNEILEAHGGRLSLQSRPGGGTVVTCWLPPALRRLSGSCRRSSRRSR